MTEKAAGAQGNTDSAAAAAAAAAAAGGADAKAAADKAAADATAAAAKTAADKAAADAAAAAGGADGKKGADDKGGKADAEASKAPDKYTLAIPDKGKDYVEESDVKAFEKTARDMGWSNAEAQAALDEHIANVADAAARFLADTKADPTYGGDHLIETQRLVKVGIDAIRPEGHPRRESFLRFLNRVGASNHIEAVSFLADLGKGAGEDRPGQSGGGGGQPMSAAEKLYDKTPK